MSRLRRSTSTTTAATDLTAAGSPDTGSPAARPLAILLSCSAVFLWSQSWRALTFSAMPAMGAELGLTPTMAGIITGLMYGGNALGVWSSGFLPWASRPLVLTGLAITVLAQWGVAAAATLPQLAVLALIGGIGGGLYFPRGASVIARYYASAISRAMGVHEVAATAGIMLGPLFLGQTLPFISWRASMALWSVVGLLVMWAYWRFVPAQPAAASHGQGKPAPLPIDMRAPAMVLMGGCMFVMVGGFVAALPQILSVGWSVAPAAAASFVGYSRLAAIAGSLIGGAVADRAGLLRTVYVGFALSAVALVAMSTLDYGFWFGLWLLFMTLVITAGTPAYFGLMAVSYTAAERERIFGVINSTASVVAVVLPPAVLGYLLEIWPASRVVGAVAVAPVVGLAATSWFACALRRARGQSRTN